MPLIIRTSQGIFSSFDELFAQDDSIGTSALASGKSITKLDQTIFIGGAAKRLGRFRVRFDQQKHFRFTKSGQNFKSLQGMAIATGRDGSTEVPVAGTVIQDKNGGYTVRAYFLNEGIGRGVGARVALVDLVAKLRRSPSGDLVVTKVRGPKYRLRSKSRACGTESRSLPNPATVPGAHRRDIGALATFSTVSVLVEGDGELGGAVSNFQAELADHLNTADLWYKRDLGVSLNATIESTPQAYAAGTNYVTPSYTYPLHDEMREHHPASTRAEYIHYLITGKSNDDGLAGVVPDLGTICVNKDDSIGFTISYEEGSTFDKETTAHEIGHLFAGEHDDAHTGSTAYLMFSGTSSRSQSVSEFSTFSKNQIGGHLSSHSSCLGSEEGEIPPGGGDGDGGGGGGEDAPVLTSLNLEHRGGLRYFRGRVLAFPYDQYSRPIRRGMTVDLYCGVSPEGPFDTFVATRRVRLRRARFIVWSSVVGEAIYCQAQSNGVQSGVVQALQAPFFDDFE